mgnify:FL=1
MSVARTYLVCYDIANPKRLRRVAKILCGYGIRIQESVFYCTMPEIMRARLVQEITPVINKDEDQVVLVDQGTNPDVVKSFITIGKKIASIPHIIVV